MVTVASLFQIMDQIGSLDPYRDLQPIRTKNFVNKFYLVLQISKIPSQNFFAFTWQGTKHSLNSKISHSKLHYSPITSNILPHAWSIKCR